MDKEFVVEVVDGVSDRLDGEMAEIGAGNSSRTARDAGSKEEGLVSREVSEGWRGTFMGVHQRSRVKRVESVHSHSRLELPVDL